MKYGDKEIFTVLGEIKNVEDRKRFVPNSPGHMTAMIARLPFGKRVSVTFAENISARSDAQLAYYWVIMGYLAEHTGHSAEEIHDAIMQIKFGTKEIELDGRKVRVRKSIANNARFPKGDMAELIEYALGICEGMDVRVPTREELGYGPK